MSEQPSSEEPTPLAYQYIVCIALLGGGVFNFCTGISEMATNDAVVRRKVLPDEHVTGDVAVREGLWKVVSGTLLFGFGIYLYLRRSSGSSSEKR